MARRVLASLEDKRVLYVDSELEVPRHCVEAILQIREMLTREIGTLESDTEIAQSLRAMRLACRKFLKVMGLADGPYQLFGAEQGHYASWTFNAALGALRGVFGIHVAKLAAAYGLSVEDDLAAVLEGKTFGAKRSRYDCARVSGRFDDLDARAAATGDRAADHARLIVEIIQFVDESGEGDAGVR